MFQAGFCTVEAGTCDMPVDLLEQIERTYSGCGWVVTIDEHVDACRGGLPISFGSPETLLFVPGEGALRPAL